MDAIRKKSGELGVQSIRPTNSVFLRKGEKLSGNKMERWEK